MLFQTDEFLFGLTPYVVPEFGRGIFKVTDIFHMNDGKSGRNPAHSFEIGNPHPRAWGEICGIEDMGKQMFLGKPESFILHAQTDDEERGVRVIQHILGLTSQENSLKKAFAMGSHHNKGKIDGLCTFRNLLPGYTDHYLTMYCGDSMVEKHVPVLNKVLSSLFNEIRNSQCIDGMNHMKQPNLTDTNLPQFLYQGKENLGTLLYIHREQYAQRIGMHAEDSRLEH
jgi:hypothetical protein